MYKHSKNIENMFSSLNGSKIYKRILTTVYTENMSELIDHGILVGFSGGADSVFLLCFLNEYKKRTGKTFPVLAVHVNHCIRGEEANRDEQFAEEFATSLGVEFKAVNINVPAVSKELGIGIEEAARNVRYSCFTDIIHGRNDISAIAVAHNATDNVETVIMNILRGSGISGICGIKPVRDNIVRPLIKISKSEIIALLTEYNIPFVIDSTNTSTDYSRNYVRNEILPLFKRLSNDPEASFTRLTEILRSDFDYLNLQVNNFICNNGNDRIPASKLRELHPSIQAKVISKLSYEKSGEYPEEKHITALKSLLQTDNFRYSLPGKCDFVCERGICYFSKKASENKLSGQIFSLKKGENKISGTNLTVFVGETDNSSLNVYNFSIQAQISSDIINDGIFLRFKTNGDAYKYHGMKHKLKKVFNDRNIPSSERELIPILCDSQGILIVPGMSERDGAKSEIASNNTTITFAYTDASNDETQVFTALLRI